MIKVTLTVSESSNTLRLVDYVDYSENEFEALDMLFDLARVHLVQVLETLATLDANNVDINALLSIADCCTSRFFVDCVCSALLKHSCKYSIAMYCKRKKRK